MGLLRVLVLNFAYCACAEGRLNLSDEAFSLISLWGRLGSALRAERSRFEDNGRRVPSCLPCVPSAGTLQTKMNDSAAQSILEPLPEGLRARSGQTDGGAAARPCWATFAKFGMMILSAVCGENEREADETRRGFLSMRDARERSAKHAKHTSGGKRERAEAESRHLHRAAFDVLKSAVSM